MGVLYDLLEALFSGFFLILPDVDNIIVGRRFSDFGRTDNHHLALHPKATLTWATVRSINIFFRLGLRGQPSKFSLRACLSFPGRAS